MNWADINSDDSADDSFEMTKLGDPLMKFLLQKPDNIYNKLLTDSSALNNEGRLVTTVYDKRVSRNAILYYYFQSVDDVTSTAFNLSKPDQTVDFSHGLDYHNYVIQDVWYYETKKFYKEFLGPYNEHNSCLEIRFKRHIIQRIVSEFIDFHLNKANNTPTKSIYKRFGRDYNKGPLVTYYYEDSSESDNYMMKLVVNGRDYDTLIDYLSNFTAKSIRFMGRVHDTDKSFFGYVGFLETLTHIFERTNHLLWWYFIYEELLDPIRDSTIKHLLERVNEVAKNYLNSLNNISSEFSEMVSRAKQKDQLRLIGNYKYEMKTGSMIIISMFSALSGVLSNFIAVESMIDLVKLVKQFCHEKFLDDHFEITSFRY